MRQAIGIGIALAIGSGMALALALGCAGYRERVCNDTDTADKRAGLVKLACVPAAEAVPGGNPAVGSAACVKAVDIALAGLDLGCILSPRAEEAPDVAAAE